MAFETADKYDIVKILGVDADALDSHLTYRGGAVTSELVTAVLLQVAAFKAIPNDAVEIFPTNSNFGVRYTPNELRENIKTEIRNLLSFSPIGFGATRLLRS